LIRWDSSRANDTPKISRKIKNYPVLLLLRSRKQAAQIARQAAPAVAADELSHFGTWTLDEGEGTLAAQVLWSDFPNFNGLEQRRTITELTNDRLRYVNELSIAGEGARVHAILSRLWKPE